jgi:hypothetical protein
MSVMVKFTRVIHQFSLFDYNAMRPKVKVPISRARVLEAKKLHDNGDDRGAAEILRDIRYKLEARYKV